MKRLLFKWGNLKGWDGLEGECLARQIIQMKQGRLFCAN